LPLREFGEGRPYLIAREEIGCYANLKDAILPSIHGEKEEVTAADMQPRTHREFGGSRFPSGEACGVRRGGPRLLVGPARAVEGSGRSRLGRPSAARAVAGQI